MDKSRTKSNLIDTTHLLREEKVIFDALTDLLDNYRDSILHSVLNEKMPFMQPNANELFAHKSLEAKKPSQEFKSALELNKSTKLVRFMYKVPQFVGPELENYGPYGEEDIANLPSEIADVLINKGKVEEIKEE